MAVERIRVEVVYARREQQRVVCLELPPGATVRNAVERSRLLEPLPEDEAKACRYGVFGIVTEPSTLVRDGDRVEIYRPLLNDAKAIRRRRAREQAERDQR